MGVLDMLGLSSPPPTDNQIYNDYGGRLRDYLLRRQDLNDPSQATGYSHGWDEPHFQAMTAFQDLLNYSADRIPAKTALSVIQQTHPEVWKGINDPETMQGIRDDMGPSRLKGSTARDILEPRTFVPPPTGKYVRAGAQMDPRAQLFGLVDNSGSPLARTMEAPMKGGQGGIPTAEQEALQKPYIDPVLLATTGLEFGPGAALASGTQQLINNQLGMPRGLSEMLSMPFPNPASIAMQGGKVGGFIDQLMSQAYSKALSNVYRTAGEGGMFEGMSVPEIRDMVKDITWTDKPMLSKMLSPDMNQAIGERMQSIVQGIGGIGPHAGERGAIPVEGLARGIGLTALIQDMRNQYNNLMNPSLQDPGPPPRRRM